MSARGQREEMPEVSESSTRLVNDAVKKYFVQKDNFKMVDDLQVNAAERNIVDQHLALFDLVMGSVLRYRGKGWQHKIDRPDATIGEGLAFLAGQTGATGAVVVSGGQTVATGGRIAASLVYAALGSLVSTGHAFLNISIIDFKTGHILWTNTEIEIYSSLKTGQGVDLFVNKVMAGLPELK